jgi:hypothetical protein
VNAPTERLPRFRVLATQGDGRRVRWGVLDASTGRVEDAAGLEDAEQKCRVMNNYERLIEDMIEGTPEAGDGE